jgi:hypothetical protein
MNTLDAPSASRLALLSLLATFLLSCALLPPEMEPLRGDLVQGEGVMIGRGTFPDGTDWNVHARINEGLLCISPWLSQGEQHGGTCSGVAQMGWAGGMEASFACGQPTFVAGSYDDSVVSVRVESTAGVHEIPAVPLRAMGLPSVAFGWAAPAEARILSVTTLDARGADLERLEVPASRACPAGASR